MPHYRTIPRICEQCGADFLAESDQVRRGGGRFCSRPCGNRGKSRPPVTSLAVRFWAKVDKDGPIPERFPELGPCWDWKAGTCSSGYGLIQGERALYAHCVALEMASGAPIPAGFRALHACDRPRCVRNDERGFYEINGVLRPRWGHLWLGTIADNNRDRDQKGRHGWISHPEAVARGAQHASAKHPELVMRGDGHPYTRHSDAEIAEIRARYAAGGVAQKELCAEYGISAPHMSGILSGKQRRHTMSSEMQNQNALSTSAR